MDTSNFVANCTTRPSGVTVNPPEFRGANHSTAHHGSSWVPRNADPGTSQELRTDAGRWIPVFCLGSFVFQAPISAVVPESLQKYLYPEGAWLSVLWMVVTVVGARRSRVRIVWSLVAILMIGWLVVGTSQSIDVRTSQVWSFAFIAGALAATVAGWRSGPETRRLFSGALLWAGTIIGLFSVYEWVVQANPFDRLYGDSAATLQHWSTYRSYGSFGHPLIDGLFLACTAAFAFGQLTNAFLGRRVLSIVCLISSFAGIACTASRSSIAGVLAASSLVLLVLLFRNGGPRTGRMLIAGLVLAGIIWLLQSPILAERQSSDEASVSAAYRSINYTFAIDLAGEFGYLGSGAGTSGIAAAMTGSATPIENSMLEALVSIGWPGVALLLILVGLPWVHALRTNQVGIAAAILALMVASTGFALWDTEPSVLVFLGLLCGVSGSGTGKAGPSSVAQADQSRRFFTGSVTSGERAGQ